MGKSTGLKLFYSFVVIVGLTSFIEKPDKDLYQEMFALVNLNPGSYDEVYLMHFDFCSPDTKCRDTLELASYLNNKNRRVALLVDTLYTSKIPHYIKLDAQHIFFINRTWLQRKGMYASFQQQLKISKKGKFKKRILLK